MQNQSESSTPRREFLGQIAVSALALAGTACAGAPAQTAAAPAATPNPAARETSAATRWDDSWSARLTAKHKAVFDMPEVDDGLAIDHAVLWLEGCRDALGAAPGDAHAVIVVRHAAVVLAFNDAMWSKYELGKERKVKDDSTGKWAVRNPYASPTARAAGDDRPPGPSGPNRPADNLGWFAQNGHTLLACDVATRGLSSILAKKVKREQRAVYEELKANLIPGVILQPSGIYAVHRAQEAGCTFSA
jgi:hypothetical protein